jgi:hypothetical protein
LAFDLALDRLALRCRENGCNKAGIASAQPHRHQHCNQQRQQWPLRSHDRYQRVPDSRDNQHQEYRGGIARGAAMRADDRTDTRMDFRGWCLCRTGLHTFPMNSRQ